MINGFDGREEKDSLAVPATSQIQVIANKFLPMPAIDQKGPDYLEDQGQDGLIRIGKMLLQYGEAIRPTHNLRKMDDE